MWAIKPFLLPSNGFLNYNSLIEIKEPDVLFTSGIQSDFYSGSESDYLYFVIKRYTNFHDPGEMAFKDAYFIWMYFYSFITGKTMVPIEKECPHCFAENKSGIDLTKAKTVFLQKKQDNRTLKLNESVSIEYRIRKLKDNIWSGNYRLENEEKTSLDLFYNFIYPQIEKVFFFDKEIDKINFLDLLKNKIGLRANYGSFLEEVTSEPWGIQDRYKFECSNCQQDIPASLSDPLSSSFYIIKEDEKENDDPVDGIVSLTSLKVLSLNEILEIPHSKYNKFSQAIVNVKKGKGYLDDIESSLGL